MRLPPIFITNAEAFVFSPKTLGIRKWCMNVERFELQIIQCAKHVLENQSRIIFTELATNKESKLFKDAVSKFRYWTDRVNYAAKPTYLFQGGISIKKK